MTGERKVQRVTTTEGRQRLPDLIQTVAIEKCIVVFHRYGRDLAALVPLDMLSKPDVETALIIPKCKACTAYFPATSADGCPRDDCPHRSPQ